MNKKWNIQIGTGELFMFAAFFLLSAITILFAAKGDLWLDEIWTLSHIRDISSTLQIFTNFKHDNNHILNTFYLYLIGDQENLYLYRILAMASGFGTIILAGLTGYAYGSKAGLFAMILSGFSYPLILYFSEARGYAPALFFSLLSFYSLLKCWKYKKMYWLFLFWSSTILGLFSHMTFIMVICALFAMIFIHEIQKEYSLKNRIFSVFIYYSIPTLFFILLYIFFIRDIEIGGGQIYNKWGVVGRTGCLLLGLPDLMFFKIVSALIIITVVFTGSIILYKEKSDQWIFFPFILFVAPILLLLFTQPEYLYFRYFIVLFPFFYLLLSYLLGKLYISKSPFSSWIVIAILIIMVAGHGRRITPLLELGRGSYQAALKHICAESIKDSVFIGSDHDFRNKTLIFFYSQFMPNNKKIFYIDYKNWQFEKPDWIITQSQDLSCKPENSLTIFGMGKYLLSGEYRFSGISGWHWFVYRSDEEQ